MSNIIYTVIEQYEPLDPTSILVTSFSSKEKQFEFFKERIIAYNLRLTKQELIEVLNDDFIEIEKDEEIGSCAVIISMHESVLDDINAPEPMITQTFDINNQQY